MKLIRNCTNFKNYRKLIFSQLKSYSSSKHKDDISTHLVDVGCSWDLHKPGENHKAEDYTVTENTFSLLKEHVKLTGGQVRTRFAPHPNGLMHLGHAKAISVNFGYAISNNGICFLRFDDTNPEESNEINCKGTLESIKWLGYEPYKVTYTSDYFDQLHEKALKLINLNLAFVCHEPPRERWTTENTIAELPSKWRDRPVEESLQEFENMQNGTYKETDACLRMKYISNGIYPDPVAYRIKNKAHFRTGDKWKIYPTYDFSHCISDSIENITHSLCSCEFRSKRLSYYWICNSLNIYCPVQIEFGRLNILRTVVSKRKINELIDSGVVSGWDDIRLYTLAALKKKGISPKVINTFANNIGMFKDSFYVDAKRVDAIACSVLIHSAKRFMCILTPIKVEIVNFTHEEPIKLSVPFYLDRSKGNYEVSFTKHFWMDEDDFKEIPNKNFWRLTEGQSVGLKFASYVISLKEIIKNSDGSINTLKVTGRPLKDGKKPKAYIHWVSDPIPCKIHQPSNILNNERPPTNVLEDINMESLTTIEAIVDRNVLTCEKGETVQFERVGYYCLDDLSTKDNLIFNRTCDLRQDPGFKQKV